MNQPDETFRDEGEELIEEIREVRRRISARFDHDPDRLVAITWTGRSAIGIAYCAQSRTRETL